MSNHPDVVTPTESSYWRDDASVLQSHHLENDFDIPSFGVRSRWDLRALGWNPNSGPSANAIVLSGFNDEWNLRAREVAIALLNPTHEVLRASGIYRSNTHAHPKTVSMKISAMKIFASWMADHARHMALHELQQHHFDHFLNAMKATQRVSTIRLAIGAVRELHVYRDVITGGGITFRPWGDAPAYRLAGLQATGELGTPVIPPSVWWPLLAACWRYIDVFSHDIFAAEEEWRRLDGIRLESAAPQRRDAEITEWLARPDSCVPVHRLSYALFKRGEIHWALLSLLVTNGRQKDIFATGPSNTLNNRREIIRTAVQSGAVSVIHGGLKTGISEVLRRDGSMGPWIDGMDPATIRAQRKVLRNACYVFSAALTMMRDSELLSLKKGAMTTFYGAPAITSRLRKRRRGVQMHNWWIIEPVAQAIAVAERLALTDDVFGTSRRNHDESTRMSGFDQHDELKKFIGQVNDLGSDAGLDEIPDFHLSPHMFRRTMSIITAQQPDGEIALGIQLKHAARRAVANATTGGYASETPEWAAEFEHELQEAVAAKIVGMWSGERTEDLKLAGAGAQRFREGLTAVEAAHESTNEGSGPKVGDDRLLRSMLRDQFSTLRWGTVNHCLGIPEQAACLQGLPAEAAAQGMMPNRCQPTTCRNSVITEQHLPVWIAEERDLMAKLTDRQMAPHSRKQLVGELDSVRKITRRFQDE